MPRLVSVIHGPAFGGAHNQALILAAPLAELGFETVVLLPTEAEEAAERLAAGGVPVERLPLRRLRASADPRTQLRFLAGLRADHRGLTSALDRHAADLVQVHGPTNPQAALAASASRRRPAVVWQLLDTRAPLWLRRATMPLVRRRADALTSWGQALIDTHPGAARLGERAVVVYPPVRAERLTPSAERARAARERLGVAPSEPLVIAIGVLNPQKGHEHLLAAMTAVLADRPDARLRILGAPSPAHGDYERRLRAMLAEQPLAGAAEILDPGRDVAELIAAADLLALASVPRSEGMPTVILEAMASGKPVVATDVGAVAELVEDGRTGLLVPAGERAALATALERLLGDQARRESMSAAALSRARSSFGLGRLAELHARAYRLALERRRQRHPG